MPLGMLADMKSHPTIVVLTGLVVGGGMVGCTGSRSFTSSAPNLTNSSLPATFEVPPGTQLLLITSNGAVYKYSSERGAAFPVFIHDDRKEDPYENQVQLNLLD